MILFDSRMIGPRPSGIGRYCLNLLRGLHEAGPAEPVRVWISPQTPLDSVIRSSPHLELIPTPDAPSRLGEQRKMARQLRALDVGLFHCPDVFAPLRAPCPTLITVHDVIPIVCRGQLRKSRKQRYGPAWRAWIRLQARRAAAVATVSHYSAGDIQRHLKVQGSKVHVIPNGVAPLEPPADAQADRRRVAGLGVSGRYILNVGRRDPYKNVDGLVRAFEGMRRMGHDGLESVALVIAGAPDRRYPEAERAVQRLGLAEHVHFVGYVDDAALAALYREAALVAMPSFYEGFGLPAVEAMLAGTPVVAAAVASLPEVVGDAALLFDAHRGDALAEAMAKALSDPELARILVERGRRRVERFSVKRFGESYIELYDRLHA